MKFFRQKEYFKNLVKNKRLGQAYLLCGPENIGKKSFALDVFKFANNREAENDLDFKFISPHVEEGELSTDRNGTKIYIEDIRKLKAFLSFKPLIGPYKFVVINNADRLTLEAANSILKSLEDPLPFLVFMLISSRPGLILPTVVSRCERVNFLRFDEKVADEETIKSINKFIEVCRQGITERLQYAKKIYEKEDYQKLVVDLIYWLHAKDKKNLRVLKNLLHLNQLLSQPQYNHRLAIENFLINL
ncbi:MAG: hypothetical protein COV30_01705 [Candidatus Yanofskybacteria bacterium CG10_big_fil_rev_8_21_14_0_10_37_15]|uniref:DNA polymerase III subunit delta n=1 Tax=Candidatus Yanofskybacteria bacterium CG10_big_fil_rev_8_21_14_0_10_37_15 TaxID=1975097 RepID=A0A2H0R5V2_9BACT|nr:MAG: hypothetical protein COV30_01705 [Candidatus Yanofskybacteria bacterium CG10_big_fil_rev_8_21_14_0_10_37_15]